MAKIISPRTQKAKQIEKLPSIAPGYVWERDGQPKLEQSVISRYEATIRNQRDLLDRAAELLTPTYPEHMMVGPLGSDMEWYAKRDQWLKDAGLEK